MVQLWRIAPCPDCDIITDKARNLFVHVYHRTVLKRWYGTRFGIGSKSPRRVVLNQILDSSPIVHIADNHRPRRDKKTDGCTFGVMPSYAINIFVYFSIA